MKKITIIDYGCGNILSITRALEKIGYKSNFSNNDKEIKSSNFLILPGVGSFKQAISLINKRNLKNTIKEAVIINKIPLLGICLGMQLILSKSYEGGEYDGLDLIEGKVININSLSKNKIPLPNINWCNLKIADNSKKDLNELNNKSFYFIHSYAAITKDQNSTIATTKYYDLDIPAVIKYKNILGCQFHPEKSGQNGLSFLKKIIGIYD